MGSAALWRACFARAAPHSASLSLLLFLNVSNVRVHLSGLPHFREGRQILVREEWLTESRFGKVKSRHFNREKESHVCGDRL